MINELKPCPFCGSDAQLDYLGYRDKTKNHAVIRCKRCGAQIIRSVSIDRLSEAINAWNRRATND